MQAKDSVNKDGAFVRTESTYRNFIGPDLEFKPESGRYHLFISWGCPFANRCALARQLKGLEKAIGMTVVHPTFSKTRPNDPNDTHRGWVFAKPGQQIQHQSGLVSFAFDDVDLSPYHTEKFYAIRDLYGPGDSKFTVPVLWDTKTDRIVNNESSEILQILNSAFNEFAEKPEVDLEPKELADEIEKVNSWVYEGINNGVYKCGFARTQQAYDTAIKNLYDNLQRLEDHLATRSFLAGDQLTTADVRVFMTLIRFDEVYVVYYKCNQRNISEYPKIMSYLRRLWKIPGFKECTKMDHIKALYYTSFAENNPFGIIPVGPNFIGQLEK